MKRTTIMRQHIVSLILALMAGFLSFFLLYTGTMYGLDTYLERSGYYTAHEKVYIDSLQKYAQEHDITSTDIDSLAEWGNQDKNKNILLQVYDDDKMLFQYYNDESKIYQKAVSFEYMEWIDPWTLRLADRTYQAVIFGDYYYKPFNRIMVVNVLGAFVVFLAVFLPGIRRRLRYIVKLKDEIEILGGGDLEYEITIRGNDELTDLAENLDQMREALKHHMDEGTRLTEEHGTIVTKLSHDIRTPLTSMNLFADLLKRGDYRDDAQRDHYLDRIQENAANLTDLADELFQIAKKQGIESASREEDKYFNLIPVLSDAAEALRLTGFMVQEQYSAEEIRSPMAKAPFMRVLNNITSNILRYADPYDAVMILCEEKGDTLTLSFENKKSTLEEAETEGSGIGIQNIRELVRAQSGAVFVDDREEQFLIRMVFTK